MAGLFVPARAAMRSIVAFIAVLEAFIGRGLQNRVLERSAAAAGRPRSPGGRLAGEATMT